MKKSLFVAMGAVIGIGAVLLSWYGNPANTGLCISCFLENISGALGLHQNSRMQYLRPEIPALVLGSFAWALWRGRFVPTGGGSPVLRFLIGILLVIGCSVFIGCPVKMVLRIAAGDIGALAGLAGLAGGIYIGLEFIENGFQLGQPQRVPAASGYVLPAIMLLLLVFTVARPAFILFSETGGGAQYAPFLLSLGVGLLIGAWAQHTQFCITGGIARIFLWGPREFMSCPRSTGLLLAIGAFFLFATVTSMLTGQFNLALHGQPSSNESYGWNFLGLALTGFGSVLVKGCPLRQLIVAGEGDTDGAVTVFGMLVGAALVQNWNLAGNSAGTPPAAQMAVVVGFLILLAIGLVNRRRGYGIAPEFQTGLD